MGRVGSGSGEPVNRMRMGDAGAYAVADWLSRAPAALPDVRASQKFTRTRGERQSKGKQQLRPHNSSITTGRAKPAKLSAKLGGSGVGGVNERAMGKAGLGVAIRYATIRRTRTRTAAPIAATIAKQRTSRTRRTCCQHGRAPAHKGAKGGTGGGHRYYLVRHDECKENLREAEEGLKTTKHLIEDCSCKCAKSRVAIPALPLRA